MSRKIYVLAVCIGLAICCACGSSSKLTSSQELNDLQGTWTGSAIINGAPETATFTVSGSLGTLRIPVGSCIAGFNVPLTMQPDSALVGSQFDADGVAYQNGYALSSIRGSFMSAGQISLTAPFQTPCQAEAVGAQFTMTN